GKSTTADMLVELLQAKGIKSQHHAFRFGILPPLGLLRFRYNFVVKKITKNIFRESYINKYDLSKNPSWRSLIYITWYGMDYFLGGIWLSLKNKFGRGRHIAVFARYFYDYYYQSNNRGLSNWIKQIIEILVPRPEYIFFLDRDAQEIHNGKPELPVCEIIKQQGIIRERLSQYPEFQVIDARFGAQKTVEIIHNILISKNI
ncbi:hypothetical protein N8Z41_03885, partial [Amylibacter sp.]|nr:hypothetical protein [Amylibacter sp.]